MVGDRRLLTLLHSECIAPLSRNIREIIIDKYCDPSLIDEIRSRDANQIRPYLRGQRGQPSRYKCFSLRNFPLHIIQIDEWNISADIDAYAVMMAETPAMVRSMQRMFRM